MDKSLDQEIRRLAGNRCEYCRLPDGYSKLRHVLDHVIAKQHGGMTRLDNLAFCCGRCNQFKGPNVAGVDPQTQAVTPLFHPRHDRWSEHFRWDGAIILGTTPAGRTTVVVLSMNAPLRVAARRALFDEGIDLRL
jgi:hypothetical protein